MKKANNHIGNRTRDLPTVSAVPQPTAPPRLPKYYIYVVSPLNAELNTICHLLALLGDHHILYISR